MIAQLVIALGPSALGLIEDLVAVWEKPTLDLATVKDICGRARNSYDSYITAARAALHPQLSATNMATTQPAS